MKKTCEICQEQYDNSNRNDNNLRKTLCKQCAGAHRANNIKNSKQSWINHAAAVAEIYGRKPLRETIDVRGCDIWAPPADLEWKQPVCISSQELQMRLQIEQQHDPSCCIAQLIRKPPIDPSIYDEWKRHSD